MVNSRSRTSFAKETSACISCSRQFGMQYLYCDYSMKLWIKPFEYDSHSALTDQLSYFIGSDASDEWKDTNSDS